MSTVERVRIGLIGTGWMGSHHGRNVVANSHASLAAIADPDVAKAEAFAREAGAQPRIYADYREMLAQPDIDAVIIASPNAMHAEHAIAAARAGKHIYLEKPMAITLADCRAVAAAVEEAGVKCAMGYHRRFNPLARHAKTLLAEGKLGDLALVESDYIHYIPGDWDIWSWLGKEEIAGSLIHAGLGHNIDLLRFFCGEVAAVSCFKDIRMPRAIQVKTEDLAVVNLRFTSGALGRAVLFVGPIVPFTFTLRLYGTKGTVDNNRVWLDTMPDFAEPGHERDYLELPREWIPDNVQGGIAEPWGECLATFIDDVRLDRAPLNDAQSGLRTAAVCFAAVESAQSGEMVEPLARKVYLYDRHPYHVIKQNIENTYEMLDRPRFANQCQPMRRPTFIEKTDYVINECAASTDKLGQYLKDICLAKYAIDHHELLSADIERSVREFIAIDGTRQFFNDLFDEEILNIEQDLNVIKRHLR